MSNEHQVGGNIAEMEPSVPLGMGDFEGDGAPDPLLTGGDEERRLNTGVLLIVAVVIVAAGVLFSMRQLSNVDTKAIGGTTAAEEAVDRFVKNLDNAGGNDDTVIRVINEDYSTQQVALSNVQRDPFIIAEPRITVDPTDDGPDDADAREQAVRERQAELIRIGENNITLNSVLLGQNPLANVNGKVVRVGDTIPIENHGVAFKVVKIQMDEVTLSTHDEVLDFTLEIVARVDRDR